ncbi:Deoxynucleotidyltransferase terminal-interacting protein 1 [Echinococcus granulosus]|nr:Deoxynucleotidyltransferase terminal-interacting protein 1 [Echinococcus granulosus]CDS20039.1 deoxynucleotidyltransferase terminal interacting [Echinococcus granulosus]
MPVDFNKGKQFNPISASSDCIPPPPLNAKHDLQYLDISKAEDLLSSAAPSVSPIASLLNPNEPGNATDFVSNCDGSKHGFPPQLHPEFPHSRVQDLPPSNLNLRYRNMLNFPKYLSRRGLAFEKRIKRSGISTDPVYALTLLRRLIQPFINREIDAIIKKYTKDFLSIAIENIRYNLGRGAVSENELQHLQYSIMMDAIAQYRVTSVESPCPQADATPTIAVPCAPTEYPSPTAVAASTPAADLRRSVLLRSSTRHLRRHTLSSCGDSSLARSPSPLSDNAGLMLLPDADASPSPLPSLGEEGDGGAGAGGRLTPAKRRRRYGEKVNSLQVGFLDNAVSLNGSIIDGDPSVVDVLGPLELELPDNASRGQGSSMASEAASNATAHSFHLDGHLPPHLLASDSFALGSCANAWLGLGAARGRIYSKHPWIFRYACDREDKSWLSRAGHLPNCGAKAFLVLAKQVHEVAAMDDSLSATTARQPLPQFTLPPWLFRKVYDSTMTRANTSRMAATNAPGPTSHRQFTNNTSSTHHQPTVQRSNFVDQFAFTEEEEEVSCHSNFFNGGVHTPLWPNGGRSPPPLRNGRSYATPPDAVYKSDRQSGTGLKIGHL